MSIQRGISLFDLLPETTGRATQIPDGIVEQIGVLTVLDHRCTTSAAFHLHEGTLQSLADVLEVDTSSWFLRIPGLTHGLPFRLAVARTAAASTVSQEAAPGAWTLDIEVRDVEVLIPGVRAARKSGGTGTTPLTLQPVSGTPAQQQVRLVAQAVLRVAGAPGAAAIVQLVDAPDPFDPTAPSGAVIRMTARPSSMLFGSSQFGMTLDNVVLDLSKTFTPADIEARGHDETWEGISYKETTFYFPPDTPLVHSLSISTRDVIIGSPGGLQGDLAIEFGEDFNDVFNTRLTIQRQEPSGSTTDVAETTPTPRGFALQYAIATGTADTPGRIRAVFNIGDDELVPGHTDLAVRGVWWRLPDGSEGNSATTPWFQAPTSEMLHYRLRVGNPADTATQPMQPSTVPDRQRELTEVQVSFPRQAGSPSGIGPIVDAVVSGETYRNVVHLRGPRERLAGVVLNSRGGSADWHLSGVGMGTEFAVSVPLADRHSVASLTLPRIPRGITTPVLLVSNANGVRRIVIDIVPQGPLAIGHQIAATANAPAQVSIVGTGVASPSSVTDTFIAKPFHLRMDRSSAPAAASISGTQITMSAGTLAEVEVLIPRGDGDPLPTTPTTNLNNEPRVVQVLFPWENAAPPLQVIYPDTAATTDMYHEDMAVQMAHGNINSRPSPAGANAVAQLLTWFQQLGTPTGTRKFYVVGRTDDLAHGKTLAENTTYNNNLAQRRANTARDLLVQANVPLGDIAIRIETTSFSPPAPVTDPHRPERITFVGRLALPLARVTQPAGATLPVWNDRWEADSLQSAQHAIAKNSPHRPPYRCAEIYASDTGTPPPPPPPPPSSGVPTRMLVPGPDGPPPTGLVTTNTAAPPTDYRVRLRAKWDSPTIVQAADAIPTEAEALVAWKRATVELPPSTSGTPPTIPPPSSTGQNYWEILLRWAYDARTGQTEASGALSLPDGAVNVRSDALAGALAFGPAITALANPADVTTDPAGQFVLAAAVLAVGAAIGELLNTGSGPDSSVDFDKFAISYRWNGASRVSATVDYTIDLRVNVAINGAGSLTGQLRLKYKNVGLRFDGRPEGGLAGVALTYDSLSVEVVNPGTWSLGGPLGNLIRIAASRIGNGSEWMEFDLEFALDLGVVRLEGATIRLGLTHGRKPFTIEFRGLTASVDIPATLRGRGSVTIGDGGSFRALLALEVIPAKLSAYGALAIDRDFVSVEVGVQLPVGLPLGATGLGIFGFMGRFVANGTRNTEGLDNTDPVQRQLDWYVRRPQDKYGQRSGQFAFGVGAVIGTLPDGAFTFNAEGSLTIGFPDVSVIFGIDAQLIKPRKGSATESGEPNADSLRILGMVLIESDSIMVAVRASYRIPKVLELQIPISAYFPLAGAGAWYIRIGTDNHATRPGSPVTITLLPETLDVRAWAFVLIEERELHGLGGTLIPADLNMCPLDFDGFSIGFGAGFELKWEAGPFKLEIIAFLVLGMGTKPLLFAGAAGVKGELDLVILSVGVDGLVHFHVSQGYNYVEGHFCGHIDLFFFEISGCVDIRIGDDPPLNIPEPTSPLAGIDLCDHLSAIKGKAVRMGSSDPLSAVWPDTIAVLRFSHYVEDGLGSSSDFVRSLTPPPVLSPWSGSTELKYAYRLKHVTLHELTGTNAASDSDWTQVPGPFDSAWWMPTHRKAIIEGGPGSIPPSTEEGRELGLFSWDPRAWSRWLGEGAQDVPGAPSQTVERVCDPPKPAEFACAYGRDRQHSTGHFGQFAATPAGGSAFPSRFNTIAHLPAGLDVPTIVALGADAGWTWHPGGVVSLHGSIIHHGITLTDGWRFPSLRQLGQMRSTVPLSFTLSKPLIEGELVLEVCLEHRDPGNTSGRCDTMPEQDGLLNRFTGTSGAEYVGPGRCFADGSERAYELNELLGAYSGTTTAVAIDLDPQKSECELVGEDSDGNDLTSTRVVKNQGRQWLRIEKEGLARIHLKSKTSVTIYRVCWGDARPGIAQLLNLSALPELAPPQVVAVDSSGKVFVLTAEGVGPEPPQPVTAGGRLQGAEPKFLHTGTVAVAQQCTKLRYVLPNLGTGDVGWRHIQIAPWRFGDVALVALCGVTLEAAQSRLQDNDYRNAWTKLLNKLVSAAATDQPTHKVYLKPDRQYEIRVQWQWQGFRPTYPGDAPDPPALTAWRDASGVERLRFNTAPFGLTSVPTPVRPTSLDADPAQGGPGYDERTFDPRGIGRYITNEQPTHEDAPHFLDDPVGFWFMVDHLQPLVDKYDRVLQVKVLHTRPEAGTLAAAPPHRPGDVHILDVTVSVHWSIDTLTWFEADHRLVQAAVAAPCVGGSPALGSSSVSVKADLEPHTEYDLLLNVAPKTLNAFPEVPVARSHFRTSRYRNPTEFLRALGFESGGGFLAPTDAIASGPLAAGALQTGDAEMDAALTTLGLDPWPLPAAPRTTAIWLRPVAAGQPWRLAAVLVEADEPVFRSGFRTGSFGEAEPPPRIEVKALQLVRTWDQTVVLPQVFPPSSRPTVTRTTRRDPLGSFNERVRNASGTRCLFVPATPIEVRTGRLYDLDLQLRENGTDGASGRMPLFDRPSIVMQEGD